MACHMQQYFYNIDLVFMLDKNTRYIKVSENCDIEDSVRNKSFSNK